MVPLRKTFESADALVALRTVHYSKLPRPDWMMGSYHSVRRMMAEDTRVAKTNHARVISRELIGRQAFLLDEPLRQAKDGRILHLLLDNSTNCHQGPVRTRGESTLSGFYDEPAPPVYGWRLTQLEPEECQTTWMAQRKALWQSPTTEVEITGMEPVTDSAQVVALQAQPPVGELCTEALVDEMYHQYIDEEQCCELGGWLNGN